MISTIGLTGVAIDISICLVIESQDIGVQAQGTIRC